MAANEPLIARGDVVLAYALTKALKLPVVIGRGFPKPGSCRGQAFSVQIALILVLHGGGKKMEDLSQIRGEMSVKGAAEDGKPACLAYCVGATVAERKKYEKNE